MILITRLSDETDAKASEDEIAMQIARINEWIACSREDIESHNKKLKNCIKGNVTDRRKRLGDNEKFISSLNIPLKKRLGAPGLTPIPLRIREVKPLTSKKQQPEYGISDEDFEYILKVIRHGGRTYETAPETFAIHGEDGLRDITLAILNSHFEGAATGETFRKFGKTDIKIESDNRAAFVAECKLWKGEKEVSKAIDQLLCYLTWRDCKAALVIFNKDAAKFSDIQKKIPDIIKGHPKFIRPIIVPEGGEWRFIIKSQEDDEQHITLHVFLFNLYVGKS
ncbi:hypothetical protein [Candidatus Magnetominusculus dajiuhuensis]|uniref:hypothetical protein n=1 Tax=Candidatus Magnetominusculus dajiuhuensis TaxID=3137712 RepID=UPI003B43CDF5